MYVCVEGATVAGHWPDTKPSSSVVAAAALPDAAPEASLKHELE